MSSKRLLLTLLFFLFITDNFFSTPLFQPEEKEKSENNRIENKFSIYLRTGLDFFHPDSNQEDFFKTVPFFEIHNQYKLNSLFGLEADFGYSKTGLRLSKSSEIFSDYFYLAVGGGINLFQWNNLKVSSSLLVESRKTLSASFYFSGTGNYYDYKAAGLTFFLIPKIDATYLIAENILFLDKVSFFLSARVAWNFGKKFFQQDTIYLNPENYPDISVNERRLTEYQILMGFEICLFK